MYNKFNGTLIFCASKFKGVFNVKKTVQKLFLAMVVVMTAMVCLAFSASAKTYSGTCGEGIKWSLNTESGKLTIKGKGEMNCTRRAVPWREYASYVKTAVISDGITRMGGNTFENCTNLTKVTLPDGLEGIGDLAFYNCENLKSITIPDSATYIGAFAFYNCVDIESIKIPNSVTEIWDGAFFGCTGLKSIKITDKLVYMYNQVFENCKSLTNITLPNSLTSIGMYTFSGCTGLKSITIPKNVEYISFSAFEDCTNLIEIKVDKKNKYFVSDKYGVLYNKNKTTLYQFPIGSTMTSYTISASIKEIYYGAFYGNKNLESIKVHKNNKNFVADKYGVLYNKDKTNLIQCPIKSKATSYTIPKSVMNINKRAFENCTNIKSLTIPTSVEYIGFSAFLNCDNLEDIYYKGKEKQWKEISVYCDDDLEAVMIHYGLGAHTDTSKPSITKATLSKKGKIVEKCSVCGSLKTTTVYVPKSIKLSATSFTYNGKAISPAVTVKDSKGNVLKNGTDYTVAYSSGRTNPGSYVAKVTFKGKYSGVKRITFTIKPSTPTITAVASTSKGRVAVAWKNVVGETGYQVYYSTNKDSGYKAFMTSKADVVKVAKNGLTSGKTYYFKVRAYKTVSGTNIYSGWSAAKAIKIK